MRESFGKSFGNAREVERFLTKVEKTHANRLAQLVGNSLEKLKCLPLDERILLTLEDIQAAGTPFSNNTEDD